jgi:hypothetical protein
MDRSINKFRLASREIFNTYFRDSSSEYEAEWEYFENIQFIEESLFKALVVVPNKIVDVVYGRPQIEILVKSAIETSIPLMLNREVDCGYWDHPVTVAVPNASFTFVKFFDWDQMGYMDNRYARVIVREWPERQDLIGKHALIETQYITYEKISSENAKLTNLKIKY